MGEGEKHTSDFSISLDFLRLLSDTRLDNPGVDSEVLSAIGT
jgi:hypothetical protein